MDELDDDPDTRKGRFGGSRTSWWKPTGAWGRAFLVAGLLLVVGAFAFTLHLCKSFLEHDARFRIAGTSNIQAVGLAEVTRADILPVFGEDVGRNIFFVPLAERRKQLEQIPWIQHATVMRLLPDQIRISIVERQPVAFVRHGQQIGLVDANGVLLNMPAGLMSQHHYSFPVLTGIDGGDPLASRKARVELYLRLMSDLDAGGKHLSDQISEIDLTDPEDARVLMPEQGSDVLAHFGQDHFLDRYQRYKAHIAEWRQQYPKLAAVDLRYEQQVVLQMSHSADDAQITANPARAKSAETKPAGAKPAAARLAEPPQAKSIAAAPKNIVSAPKATAAAKNTTAAAPKATAKPDPARYVASGTLSAAGASVNKAPATHPVAAHHTVKAPAKPPLKANKAAGAKSKAKKHPAAQKSSQKTKQKTPSKPRASTTATGQ
jgi:cell division protein FtsQ